MQFVEDFCSTSFVIVVNGYFPSLSVKQILTTISESLLGFAGSFSNVMDHVLFVNSKIPGWAATHSDIYIIIHNIDGVRLRSDITQNVLSILASNPHVHIVASIDHINAPILWDHDKLFRFNWLWHDCTTLL